MRARGSAEAGGASSTRSALGAVAIIVLTGFAVAAAVGVRGDFPLSDDWSYAHVARGLCTNGALEFLPWTGASLVFQAGYGALLCKLFGFSFTVLRASTLLLAIGGAIAFHLMLRRLGVDGPLAALAVATCCLGPLYVNLTFTWMTDVPFTALAILAGYLYVVGLSDGRLATLVTAGVVCALALLVRQHGIFVAAAAALTILGSRSLPLSRRLVTATAAAGLPAIVFVAFHVWLVFFHGAPSGLQDKASEAVAFAPLTIGNSAFRAVAYVGLLLVPLAVVVAPRELRERPAAVAAALAVMAALALFLFARERALMFYLPNVIYDFGLGPLSLRDTQFLGAPAPLHVGVPFAALVTLVSTIAAALVLTSSPALRVRFREPAVAFVALAALLLFAGSLLHTRFYFDRYLLPVLPFVAAAIAAGARGLRVGAAAWAASAALAWFAVAGTHDYMEWNRARYAGLAELERGGATAEQIDGGVEYNGWHLAARLWTWPTAEQARIGQPPSRRSWWWVVDDRYVLAFRELEGYDVVRELTYHRWLVPGTGRVLVLERNDTGIQRDAVS